MIYRQKATLSAPIIIIFCCCPSARHMEGLVVTQPRAHPYGFVIQKRMIYLYCPPDMAAGKFSFHASSVNQVKIAQATNIA